MVKNNKINSGVLKIIVNKNYIDNAKLTQLNNNNIHIINANNIKFISKRPIQVIVKSKKKEKISNYESIKNRNKINIDSYFNNPNCYFT